MKGKRHREMGWFQTSYFHSSSPLPLPNLGSSVKLLPITLPGCEHLHAEKRKAGTRLVTHPCPGVTKLKFCLYILSKIQVRLDTAVPALQYNVRGGSTIAVVYLSHSAAVFWRRDADIPRPPSTGRRTDSSSLTL